MESHLNNYISKTKYIYLKYNIIPKIDINQYIIKNKYITKLLQYGGNYDTLLLDIIQRIRSNKLKPFTKGSYGEIYSVETKLQKFVVKKMHKYKYDKDNDNNDEANYPWLTTTTLKVSPYELQQNIELDNNDRFGDFIDKCGQLKMLAHYVDRDLAIDSGYSSETGYLSDSTGSYDSGDLKKKLQTVLTTPSIPFAEQYYYILYEYGGESINKIIFKHSNDRFQRCISMFIYIISIIKCFFVNNIVHTDIKMENIVAIIDKKITLKEILTLKHNESYFIDDDGIKKLIIKIIDLGSLYLITDLSAKGMKQNYVTTPLFNMPIEALWVTIIGKDERLITKSPILSGFIFMILELIFDKELKNLIIYETFKALIIDKYPIFIKLYDSLVTSGLHYLFILSLLSENVIIGTTEDHVLFANIINSNNNYLAKQIKSMITEQIKKNSTLNEHDIAILFEIIIGGIHIDQDKRLPCDDIISKIKLFNFMIK